MKKLCILIVMLLLSGGLYSQQLTYRFANPRIIRVAGVDRLEFEVQIQSSVSGTYLWAAQVKLNFNNTTFYTSASNWLITINPALTFNNEAGNPAYAKTANMVVGTPYVLAVGITGNADVMGYSNMPDPQDVVEVPNTSWLMLFKVSAKLQVVTGDVLAGINFLEVGMNGFQQYITAPSTAVLYQNPNLYDPANLTNIYTGRLFSAMGWSQIGNTSNAQWVNWSNNVSTSVWEGSASTAGTPGLMKNLRIENGAILTVPSGVWLTVDAAGTIVNTGTAANLVVASGGSLIQPSAALATVQRYVGPWIDDAHGWHLLSSPVVSQTISPNFIDADPLKYDFYKWDEPTAYWLNQKVGANNITSFVPGTGYLVAYQDPSTRVFTGTLNSTDVTVTGLTNTPGPAYSGLPYGPGWNLVGNPFTSALTWNSALWVKPAEIDAIAKVWDQAGAAYVDKGANGIIPALNGMMVYVSSGSPASLTIPKAARVHDVQPWYKATGSPYIKLVAHNQAAQTYQESVVTFDSQSTNGYDADFDSHFLPGYAPQFYSVEGAEELLSTNTLPTLNGQTTVPFNFIKTEGAAFTIEATQIENVPAQVYLTDLKLSKTQNLVENPVYEFTAANGDVPARFLLSFGNFTGMGENNLNSIVMYTYENNLYIVNPGKARLEVYNITGQRLQASEINSPGLFKTTLYLPTAYYVVRLTTGTNVVVKKVFIKS
jgi:hypothetical protein